MTIVWAVLAGLGAVAFIWGLSADATGFDAARIIDNATFEKPQQYSREVEHVTVNGSVVLDQGRHTGARPGAVLRR